MKSSFESRLESRFVGWGVLLLLGAGCDSITAVGTDGGSTSGTSSTGSPVTTVQPDPTGSTNTMTSAGVSTSPTDTSDNSTTTGGETATESDTMPGTTGSSTGGELGSSTGGFGRTTGESTSTGGESSGSTGGSTGSTSGESDTISFIDPSESGGGVECDPYEQDCMDGEKCNAWASSGGSWDALGCFPLDDDPAGPGEPCSVEGSGTSGIDSCDVGGMCWNVDGETSQGTCISMCTGSPAMPNCADPATTCVIQNDGVLNLCLPTCDPLEQDCANEEACYFVDDGFVCAPDASGEGFGGEGDPCEFINACEAGFSCANADTYGGCGGASGCCTAFCDTEGPDTCAVLAHECVAVFEEGEAPPGLEDVGLCGFPA